MARGDVENNGAKIMEKHKQGLKILVLESYNRKYCSKHAYDW